MRSTAEAHRTEILYDSIIDPEEIEAPPSANNLEVWRQDFDGCDERWKKQFPVPTVRCWILFGGQQEA